MTRAMSDVLDRAAEGGRIGPDEALLLYTDAPLHALGQAADAVRRRRYPDNVVTYIIDRNINYTNVCVTACKFCAFYRAPKHAGGWSHPMEEILHMAKVSGVSIEEAVRRIKAAGLDSIAGAGAEMLPARPRAAIAPLKESGARWIEVMATAHRNGLS